MKGMLVHETLRMNWKNGWYGREAGKCNFFIPVVKTRIDSGQPAALRTSMQRWRWTEMKKDGWDLSSE
jgi:hypothetical protein